MKAKKYFFYILLASVLVFAFLWAQTGAAAPPTHTLTTEVVGSGSVDPASGTFKKNETITITAVPATGWTFDHWEGDLSGSENPTILRFNSDKHVVAVFVEGGPTPTPTPTPVPTSTPMPTPTPSSSGDFSFSVNYKPPSFSTGYLVRGELTLSDCPLCFANEEPRYDLVSGYGADCSYDSNRLSMVSLDGFEGSVTLEVLNLPAGVTSEMPNSVFVPSGGVGSTMVALRAAANATAGDATVMLRGTSGTIVHTVDVPITVADLLPPCLNGPFSVQGGNSVEWAVSVGGPVATDTAVTLTSSNPAVASVPASITIPAGSSEVTLTVNTSPVNQRTNVTITASVDGFSNSRVLSVDP